MAKRGICLAGGRGVRLLPLTKIFNKHMLYVGQKIMIEYPLETLRQAGIEDVMLVTGAEHSWQFMNYLGSGEEFGINLTYRIQDKPDGISGALKLAEEFARGEKIAAILGDNLFEDNFKEAVDDFWSNDEAHAEIFVKEVENPARFGVVEMNGDGGVVSIEEKPANPKSCFAQTGLYLYDSQVFDSIRSIKPSARGELEITAVNNCYLKKGQLRASLVNGYWSDMGVPSALLKASNYLANRERLHGTLDKK